MTTLAARRASPIDWRRALLLTVIGLALAWTGFAVLTIATSSNAAGIGSDMRMYQDAARRWMAGGDFYYPYQLAGPYVVPSGWSPLPTPVMYPPVALAFLVPASFLPAVAWYGIPLGVTAWIVWSWRPSLVGWAGIGICASMVASIWSIVAGNPVMWVLMVVALSTRWRWVSAFVLLKPSLFPFALPGIRDPRWWLVVAGMGAVTLALWPLTLDWFRVVLNASGDRSGVLYSLREVPLLLIPWIAWASRRRDAQLARAEPLP